jgi:hypothetical protein
MGLTTGPGSSTIGPLAPPSRRHLALALALMAVAAMTAVGVGPADAPVHRPQLASPISDGPAYEGDFADPAIFHDGKVGAASRETAPRGCSSLVVPGPKVAGRGTHPCTPCLHTLPHTPTWQGCRRSADKRNGRRQGHAI